MDPVRRGGITHWLETIMTGFGAGWVMWLLIGLSVISVAIILERLWFFYSLRDDLTRLDAYAATGNVAWCMCKHSGNGAFCDGSHNRLP